MDKLDQVSSDTSVPMQEEHSALPSDLAAPAGKLDADIYNAEDLDGVTESLFGSGNLNYLMLQGRQNDTMLANGGFDAEASAAVPEKETHVGAGADARALASMDADDVQAAGGKLFFGGAADRISANGFAGGGDARGGIGSGSAGGAGGEGGLSSASTAKKFSSSFTDHTSGGGHDGLDGQHGGDGGNGQDGTPGEGVGDIVNNIVNNAGDTLNNVLNEGTDIVNTTVNEVTDIVNNILHPPGSDVDLFVHNDLGLNPIDANLDTIENVVGDIDVGVGVTHGDNGAALDVGAVVAGIPLADMTIPVNIPVDLPVVDSIVDNLPGTDALLENPVGALGDFAENTLADSLADVQNVLQDPAGTINGIVEDVSDIDGIVSGALDTVNAVVDGLPLTQGLLGGDILNNPVETVTGLTGDIPVVGDVVQGLTDQLGDLPDLGNALQDPVDAVTDLTENLPVVGDVAQGLTDQLGGGLPDLGNVLQDPAGAVSDIPVVGDVVQGLTDQLGDGLPDMGNILQDPAGAVTDLAEGLLGGGPTGGDADLIVNNDLGLPQLNVNLDPVEGLVGDIDILADASHTDSSATLGLDALALGGQIVDTAVPLEAGTVTDTVDGLLDGGLPGGGDTGLPSLDPGSLTGLADSLLGGDSSDADSDLVVNNDLGLQQINVNLDPVEGLVGDIDILADASHTDNSATLGLDALALGGQIVDTAIPVDAGTAADSLDSLLGGVSPGDDTGLPLDTGSLTGLADGLLGGGASPEASTASGSDMPLSTDAVESIIADVSSIGSAADSAISLLAAQDTGGAGSTDGILSDASLSDIAAWPQNTIADATDMASSLGSLVGGIADGAQALPEPTGTVSEGLGLVAGSGDHSGGLLSGLHSGHHGGLFG